MQQKKGASGSKWGEKRITALRSRLQPILKEIFGEDQFRIERELSLFDYVFSRRDFLKASTLAAITATISTGCVLDHHREEDRVVPSNWDIWGEELDIPGKDAPLSMKKGVDIVADSDIVEGIGSYAPVPAYGSEDAPNVVAESLLEGVNSYVVTMADETERTAHADLLSDRNFGLPEYLHLVDDTKSGQSLLLYHKDADKSGEMYTEHISLEADSIKRFEMLRAVNGSFHNRIVGTEVTVQKMALLSGMQGFVPALVLYYQTGSVPLQISHETQKPGEWQRLDILDSFRETLQHPFREIEVVEMESYQDGLRKGVLYGTLRCDGYYHYGFVIALNDPQQREPTVSFFAPHFLSIHSDMIRNLIDSFSEEVPESSHSLASFSIFQGQRFRPFAPLVQSDESHTPHMLFSFVSYDISEETDAALEIRQIDAAYSFERYRCQGWRASDNGCEENYGFLKRYLLSIDTSLGGIVYPLQEFEPEVRIETMQNSALKLKSFRLIFDTAPLDSLDILQRVFDGNMRQMEDAYIRFVRLDGEKSVILLATVYDDYISLGVLHKRVTVQALDSGGASVSEDVSSSKMLFENAEHGGSSYHHLWFNTFANGFGSITGLAGMLGGGGRFTFHATQNREGVLRSTFLFERFSNSYGLGNLLVAFDEKREVSAERLFGFTQLHERITADATEHMPPLPVAVNVHKCFFWNAIQNDTEILYSARRRYLVNETEKTLYRNDNSQGRLYSYFHAVRSTFDGSWSRFETLGKAEKKDLKRDMHQVHLHTLNSYGMSVTLPEESSVEIRFSKPLTVRVYSESGASQTHHLPALNTLFVQPDSQGRIALEIEAGYREDQYSGAMMEYRIVDRSKIAQSGKNSAVYLLSDHSGSISWRSFNISFRLYRRFRSESYEHLEYGTAHTETAHQALKKRVDEKYHTLIPKFANAFSKIHDHAAPDNAPSAALGAETVQPVVTVSTILAFRSVGSDLGSWFGSVAQSVEDDLESFAEDLKEILDDMAKDIEDIINMISDSVVHAVGELALAIQKCWKAVVSFARMLWHWLKSLFDFDKGLEIGQELKQLMVDQLYPLDDPSSQNTAPNNIYTLLESTMNEIKEEIADIQTELNNTVDSAFGQCCPQDGGESSYTDTARQNDRDAKSSSTMHMHIFDQLKRLLQHHDITDSAPCSYVPGSALGDLLTESFTVIGENTCTQMQAISHDGIEGFKRLAAGSSLKDSGLAVIFADLAHLFINDMASLAEAVVEIPKMLLDEMVSFSHHTSCSQLSQAEAEFLEILSLLLFRDRHKIESFEMLIFFLMGYPVSIMETLLGSIDAKFDISEYIRSGAYRRDFNASGQPQQLLTAEDNDKLQITPQTIYAVLSVIQVVLSLIVMLKDEEDIDDNDDDDDEDETKKKHSKLEMLLPYFYVFRGVAKNPNILKRRIVYDSDSGRLDKYKNTFSMISFFFRFGGEFLMERKVVEEGEDKPIKEIDDICVWFGVAAEISAAVTGVISTYISQQGIHCLTDDKLETEDEVKCLEFITALMELARAAMLIYIEPTKHTFEKTKDEEAELLKDAPELVMAMLFWGGLIVLSFGIDLDIYLMEET